jgi:hypothetical protein
MNKKLAAELILLTVFYLAGLCHLLKVPDTAIITVICGGVISTIYFYGAYWLFAQPGMPALSRIVFGVAYTANILACIYSFLHWAFADIFSIISFAALAVVIAICLFNYKSPGYKSQLYKCIFFLAALLMLFSYRHLIAK